MCERFVFGGNLDLSFLECSRRRGDLKHVEGLVHVGQTSLECHGTFGFDLLSSLSPPFLIIQWKA